MVSILLYRAPGLQVCRSSINRLVYKGALQGMTSFSRIAPGPARRLPATVSNIRNSLAAGRHGAAVSHRDGASTPAGKIEADFPALSAISDKVILNRIFSHLLATNRIGIRHDNNPTSAPNFDSPALMFAGGDQEAGISHRFGSIKTTAEAGMALAGLFFRAGLAKEISPGDAGLLRHPAPISSFCSGGVIWS
jgi:hypothetical protein